MSVNESAEELEKAGWGEKVTSSVIFRVITWQRLIKARAAERERAPCREVVEEHSRQRGQQTWRLWGVGCVTQRRGSGGEVCLEWTSQEWGRWEMRLNVKEERGWGGPRCRRPCWPWEGAGLIQDQEEVFGGRVLHERLTWSDLKLLVWNTACGEASVSAGSPCGWWDYGGSRGAGVKWRCWCILKAEPPGFADGLGVERERKKDRDLQQWQEWNFPSTTIGKMGEEQLWGRVWGRIGFGTN